MSEPQTIISGLLFPECPRWHDGSLYFSDIYANQVIRSDCSGATQVIAELPRPSGLGWLPNGSLQAVSMAQQRLYSILASGRTKIRADLSRVAAWPSNDMVVTPQGFAYIGQVNMPRASWFLSIEGFADPPLDSPGPIVLVNSEGRVMDSESGFIEGANGMVTADGGRTLIVAENPCNRLLRFDVQDDGLLSGRTVFADLDDRPDGIAIDDEQGVWVAHPRSKRAVRVLEGGEVTDELRFERHAIACALGGDDGRTLFVCTNEYSISAQPPADASRMKGRIEVARVKVPASS